MHLLHRKTISVVALISLAAVVPGAARGQEASASLKQADADYKAGVAALGRHDLKTARDDFARVVRLAPQAEQGHSALGAVLVSLGETERGMRELEKALAMKPSDDSAQLNLALAYTQTGAEAKALPLFAKLDAAAKTTKRALPPYVLAAYARALAASQPAAAISKMQAAVAAEPENAELRDEFGSLYAQQREWAKADEQFAEALRLNPKLASAHLHLGASLQAQHKPGALDELSQAAQLAPEDEVTALELGKELAAEEQDDKAIPIFQAVLAADPASIEASYQLGLALQRTGKAEAAIPLLEKTVGADAKNAEALTNLGMALTQVQRAKDAVPRLQEAVRLAPRMVIAHQDLAAAYIQLNQVADAIVQLRLAIGLAPDAPQLHYNLGLALKMQDDGAAAIPELELAEKQNPSASEPPYVLGILYMQVGRYEEAAKELDRSLKLQPENGDGWATLGSVYAKLDKLPEAVAALRKAIEQIPQQPDPHLTLAGVLVKQGQTAEAAAERRKAGELMRANMNRQRAEVAANSAKSLLQSGKVEDAIAQFKDALSYDSGYADAHRGLAEAYAKNGDTAAAADERQKAEALENAAKP